MISRLGFGVNFYFSEDAGNKGTRQTKTEHRQLDSILWSICKPTFLHPSSFIAETAQGSASMTTIRLYIK
jgi:hypothetical protein